MIRSNVVGRNQQNGIFLSSVHSSDISRNDASGNGIGMQIIGSGTDNTVSHNIINGNDVGLIIGSGASVHNNVTIGNRYNGIDVYGPNVEVSNNTSLTNGTYGFVNADYDLFDHTADCSGNVWSDNTFFTANQSCIR